MPGLPALGRSHAALAAEQSRKIIAVAESALESDLADRQPWMQFEQDLRFLQPFFSELFPESRMQVFPEDAAEIIRIDAQQIGQVGQRDIFLIMIPDERQTILNVKLFVAAFDTFHAAAEGDGAEFEFKCPAQEKCLDAQFSPPVFPRCAGRFPVKEIRRDPVWPGPSAEIEYRGNAVFEPDRHGEFKDAIRAFPAETAAVPGDFAAAGFIAAA